MTALVIASMAAWSAGSAPVFSDEDLIDGFNRTVFGSEYRSLGWQSAIVKKYTEPVRFHVDDRSGGGRGEAVAAFVRSLPAAIRGLDVELVGNPDDATFRIFIVDRAAYKDVVTREIYDRPSSSFAPGKCLVRVVSTGNGITRSDAVIVADEGDFLFRRCMAEEVLQGLGPVNDDPTLDESVFNDRSRHTGLTAFDRLILNMLYHPLIRPGMTKFEARRALPAVLESLRGRR